MNVIARKTLQVFWTLHPRAKTALAAWYRITRQQRWNSFADLRGTFNSADQVGGKVVFNIGGNNYRLVGLVAYRTQRVFVIWIGTHAEYDRINVAEL
jgi:mRNA interferase HigB